MSQENESRFGLVTSFKEAGSRAKIAATNSLSIIQDWYEDQKEELQSKIDAAAQETEDKDFWGGLVTIGTTLGCTAITGNLGACVAAGTAAGGATRAGVDLLGDAEEGVNRFHADPPDTHYYRDKAPELADTINNYAGDISDSLANEWKADILKQFGSTLEAAKLGYGLDKLGLFEAFNPAETAVEPAAELLGDSTFFADTFDPSAYSDVGITLGDDLSKVVVPDLEFGSILEGAN